jgi:hypothetical protein
VIGLGVVLKMLEHGDDGECLKSNTDDTYYRLLSRGIIVLSKGPETSFLRYALHIRTATRDQLLELEWVL